MSNLTRYGTFSSSQIYKLMSKGRGNWSIDNVGASFNTYLKEKYREIKLQKPINPPIHTRPIVWGKVMEGYVFENHLSLNYKEMNEFGRLSHPELKQWTGIPDTMRKDVVCDIKCPTSLTQFCDLIDSFESAEALKKEKPEYYWQLVSNAILTDVDKAELIVYMPFESELKNVLEYVADTELQVSGLTSFQWEWIFHEIQNYQYDNIIPSNVPYLNDKGSYSNLTKFEFDIPAEDKKTLTERVKLATEQLNQILN